MAAVWCHWCHVMEGTTYRDPAIQAAILDRFIAVRVDQDADPDLSYRYENWGWPATIMLDKDGNEIFKRRGYIPPELFAKLLVAVIEDPSALPSYAMGRRSIPTPLACPTRGSRRPRRSCSGPTTRRHGGFGEIQRFLHGDTLEWALERSRPLRRNVDTETWRDVAAQHARRRAAHHRSGVGRHVPVFRQARLVGTRTSRSC